MGNGVLNTSLHALLGHGVQDRAKKRMQTGIENAIVEQISKLNHAASSGATDAANRTEQKAHASDRVQTGANNHSATKPPAANHPPKAGSTAGPSKPMASANNQPPMANQPPAASSTAGPAKTEAP